MDGEIKASLGYVLRPSLKEAKPKRGKRKERPRKKTSWLLEQMIELSKAARYKHGRKSIVLQ